jgi:uracil-DNA glycosylase family 4
MDSFHLADRPCVAEAIEAAARCNTLEELYEAIKNYKGHEVAEREGYTPSWPVLKDTGHPDGPLMFINEKPELPWDRESARPFEGKDYGWSMKEVLGWYDVNLDEIHTTFACHWAPGAEKAPNATQIAASRPFLFREIELVKPRAILAQGRAVIDSLLMYREPITPWLGMAMQWKRGDLRIPAFLCWHSAYPARFTTKMGEYGNQIRDFFSLYGMPDGSQPPVKNYGKKAA